MGLLVKCDHPDAATIEEDPISSENAVAVTVVTEDSESKDTQVRYFCNSHGDAVRAALNAAGFNL